MLILGACRLNSSLYLAGFLKGRMQILVFLLLSFHAIFAEVCPSTSWTCPKFMTCCMLPSGQEGCCPYENATCCMDRVHCCPQGSTCDVRGGHCRTDLKTSPILQLNGLLVTGNTSIDRYWKEKQLDGANNSALRGRGKDNGRDGSATNKFCPDGGECFDGSTCCLVSSGGYGCCPFPNAVCCSDEQHCCPSDSTCSATGFCNKFIEENIVAVVKNKECPGGRQQCKPNNTCCPMAPGEWGCCPLPDAVCCSDKLHCCPGGYTCLSTGTCIEPSNVPWKN